MNDPERPFTQNRSAVYDLGAPERSVFIQNTGQSGNPLSSNYEDFAEPWRDGHSLPMLSDHLRPEEDAGVDAKVRFS